MLVGVVGCCGSCGCGGIPEGEVAEGGTPPEGEDEARRPGMVVAGLGCCCCWDCCLDGVPARLNM